MAKQSKPRVRSISLEVPETVLAIDSNYEPATKAAFDYREKHVYPQLSAAGFAVSKLQGPLARRAYAANAAKVPGTVYITGVGHGSYDTYTGHWYDPVFRIGNYDAHESTGKIVHLLSCQTGRDLGPDFVRNGCLAYFGYDEDFVFDVKNTDVFFECDSEIDLAFAAGLTAAQVYDRVIALFNDHILAAENAGQLYTASLLEEDRDRLRAPASGAAWGQGTARL